MSAAQVLEPIHKLPFAGRREVFERRGEELQRNPARGIPWEQVRAELKERIKSR